MSDFRTVHEQIGVEAKMDRAVLDNPNLPASFIAECLKSLAEPRESSTPFVPRSVSLRPHQASPT